MSALPPKADINLCQAVFEKTKAKLARRSGKLAPDPPTPPDPVLKTQKRDTSCPHNFLAGRQRALHQINTKRPDGSGGLLAAFFVLLRSWW
jgi:hypothetical protein